MKGQNIYPILYSYLSEPIIVKTEKDFLLYHAHCLMLSLSIDAMKHYD